VLRFLLVAILIIVIARSFWTMVDGIIEGAGGTPRRRRGGGPGRAPVKLVRDPVCGTFVAPNAALSTTARGETHYFCSEQCRRQFH
jgi:YHS domain-containing protein